MIGWGILGNATIARLAVAPAIAASGNGRLVAVGSRSLERARALTNAHGGQPLTGYDAVLDHPNVDAIYIPLPNHLHKPWTLKALNAGKHVLVEKPFALNADEAAEMVAAADAAGLHLMEAFMWRFHPRSQRIRQLIRDGALGSIGSIRSAFTFPVTPNDSNQRLFSAAMGGGSLWDVGTYGVSAARFFLDAEPTSVSATAVFKDDVDVNFAGTLQFPSGTLAVVESGFHSALQQTYAIQGTKAAIELPRHNAFVPGRKDAAFLLRPFDAEVGERHTVPGANQYQLMVEQFAARIRDVSKPPIPATDSIHQMRVLDALMQSAHTGHAVAL